MMKRSAPRSSRQISPPAPIACANYFDPSDRRYPYPFINCTNCGPRVHHRSFAPLRPPHQWMHSPCAPHARQNTPTPPTALPCAAQCVLSCGPHITWREKVRTGTDAWERRDGITPCCGHHTPEERCHHRTLRRDAGRGIVAIKGLGFHLACDASNEHAVRDLRRRSAGRTNRSPSWSAT